MNAEEDNVRVLRKGYELWSQTKATTPILLTCVLGAFFLVNATVGSATLFGQALKLNPQSLRLRCCR